MLQLIAKNVTFLLGGRILSDAAGMLLFVVLSQKYGPSGIGIYAYGFALAGIAYAVVNLGLEEFIIREYARDSSGVRRQMFNTAVSFQSLLSILTLALVALISRWNAPSLDAWVTIILLTVFQICMAFSRTFFAPLHAAQKMMIPAITELLSRIAGISIVIILIFFISPSLAVAIIPLPVSAIILLIFSIYSAQSLTVKIDLFLSYKLLRKLILSTWPFAASVIVFHVYARIDLIMVTSFLGEETTGIYAPCLKILEITSIPLFFIGLAFYPLLTKFFSKHEDALPSILIDFGIALLVASFFIAWCLFFIAPLAITPLLGAEFSEAIPFIQMMSFFSILMACEAFCVRILWAAERQVSRVKIQAIGTLLNIVLNALLLPRIGILGAIIATAISSFYLCLAYYKVIAGFTNTSFLFKPLCLTILFIILPFAIGGLTSNYSQNTIAPSLFSMTTFILSCPALYAIRFLFLRKIKAVATVNNS